MPNAAVKSTMTHPPTQTEIRALLNAAGLRPQKRHGQHFLIDGNLLRVLVEAAELGPADTVLEVGPGIGNLTGLLVEAAGRVVAVEIDPDIAAVALWQRAEAANLDLLVADILADKHTLDPAAMDLLGRRQRELGGPVKLVANLPYSAATPLVAELVALESPPERLVFTVQEEVALRFAADPGTRDYGPVSVLIQALATVEVLRRLSPGVFWPRPRVGSAMVRIRPQPDRRRRIADLAVFRRTVEGLFAHRRKRASRSLSLADPAGDPAEQWAWRLEAAGLEPAARGEAYTVEEVVRLANWLAEKRKAY
jgi:16S rRNA (adenine1518-N6/adenine1519-N6)-dimethyltransferase